VDVGIILRVDSFEFGMQSLIACARQAGVAFRYFDKGIPFVEIRIVIVAWQPGRSLVGDFIGLRRKGFVLNESTEWFGVPKELLHGWIRSYTCTQFLLVITTR